MHQSKKFVHIIGTGDDVIDCQVVLSSQGTDIRMNVDPATD